MTDSRLLRAQKLAHVERSKMEKAERKAQRKLQRRCFWVRPRGHKYQEYIEQVPAPTQRDPHREVTVRYGACAACGKLQMHPQTHPHRPI